MCRLAIACSDDALSGFCRQTSHSHLHSKLKPGSDLKPGRWGVNSKFLETQPQETSFSQASARVGTSCTGTWFQWKCGLKVLCDPLSCTRSARIRTQGALSQLTEEPYGCVSVGQQEVPCSWGVCTCPHRTAFLLWFLKDCGVLCFLCCRSLSSSRIKNVFVQHPLKVCRLGPLRSDVQCGFVYRMLPGLNIHVPVRKRRKNKSARFFTGSFIAGLLVVDLFRSLAQKKWISRAVWHRKRFARAREMFEHLCIDLFSSIRSLQV